MNMIHNLDQRVSIKGIINSKAVNKIVRQQEGTLQSGSALSL